MVALNSSSFQRCSHAASQSLPGSSLSRAMNSAPTSSPTWLVRITYSPSDHFPNRSLQPRYTTPRWSVVQTGRQRATAKSTSSRMAMRVRIIRRAPLHLQPPYEVSTAPYLFATISAFLPFSALAEKTDLYIVVANWPTTRREHWLTLLRARAIENQAYVAGVNRAGTDPQLKYSGDSVLFAPDGTQLTELSSDERVIFGNVEASCVAEWRASFPALSDRRPEVYKTIGAAS